MVATTAAQQLQLAEASPLILIPGYPPVATLLWQQACRRVFIQYRKRRCKHCVASGTVFVNQPPGMQAAISQTNVSCFGLTDGKLSAVAGQAHLLIRIHGRLPQAHRKALEGLRPDCIYLTVQDSGNCTANFTAGITQPQPLFVNISYNSISCFGSSNGGLIANCSGGTPGFSYTWSPVASSSSVISGLSSGTYSVAVKDANNCTTFVSAVLTPPSPLNASILTTTPTCGTANGSATAQPTGGTPGYGYIWQPGGSTLSAVSGLAGGTYSVSITDSKNCIKTLTFSVTVSTSVSLNVTGADITCNGINNGWVGVNASGGISPYTYSWSASPPMGQGTPTISGLAVGNYSVQVKDYNNCSVSATFSITAPSPLAFNYSTSNVSCFGGSNGNLSVVAVGGVPPYSYLLNSVGQIGSAISNLQAGNYTLTIKDSKNCSQNSSFIISQPPALQAVTNVTHVACFGTTSGAAVAGISGGVPPYSFSWFPNGGNSNTVIGLSSGTYSLVTNDNNNCVISAVVSLTQPAAPLGANVWVSSATCFGKSNGSGTVQASGGTPGYSLSWYNLPVFTHTAGSLGAGTYSVLIVDAHNCNKTVTLSIIEPLPMKIVVNVPKICSGVPATITASVNNGVNPIKYSWNGVTQGASTLSFTPVTGTVLSVFASDANGCFSNTDTVSIIVPEPMLLNAGPGFSVCQGDKAWLSATAAGGDGNYTYLWKPGNMKGSAHHIQPAAAQVYTVNVTDGCLTTASQTVETNYFPLPNSEIISSGAEACAPACITFSCKALFSSGLISAYEWSFGDGLISGLSTPMHCYNKPGNYPVQLNYSTINGCMGTQLLPYLVHVNEQPIAGFVTDKTILDATNPRVNFTNLSLGATSYTWHFSNEASSISEHPTYAFAGIGRQLVVLIAANDLGCTDTLIKEINIKPEFTFYSPTAFSPNGDNLNDVFLPKGVGWNSSGYELVVYDRWGERVFNTNDHSEGWSGKVRNSERVAPEGIYIWKILLYDVFNKRYEFVGHVMIENKM